MTFAPLPHTSWSFREVRIGGTIQEPLGDFLTPGKLITVAEALDQIQNPPADIPLRVPVSESDPLQIDPPNPAPAPGPAPTPSDDPE